MSSPQLQGERLKITAARQNALAEAIAERVGIDTERGTYPQTLAGAVTAAAQVAVRRWFNADPPTPFLPLLRLALRQLATACSAPS
jgi:hypothetical protein